MGTSNVVDVNNDDMYASLLCHETQNDDPSDISIETNI